MTGYLAVETERLSRTYQVRAARRGGPTSVVALDEVTLQVRRGEVFGLLGVNGAGKSTLLKILSARLRPSSGTARVAGFDVCRYARWVRRHIGVAYAGEASTHPWLRLVAIAPRPLTGRAIPLSTDDTAGDLFGAALADRAGSSAPLSPGLQQRLHVARGIANGPRVLFLDQPTLGLDVAAAREIRACLRRWIDADPTRTVVMATQDLREANELCDRVAILDEGRLVACDTPSALRARLATGPTFDLVTSGLDDGHAGVLEGVSGVERVTSRGEGGRTQVELVLRREDAIGAVLSTLAAFRVELIGLTRRVATLEDVLLDLVARRGPGRKRPVGSPMR